jgi:hypothetical protein
VSALLRRPDTGSPWEGLARAGQVPAVALGMLPIVFTALAVGALLWGTGNELPFVGSWKPVQGSADTRDAVAWLGGLALFLVLAHPLLRFAARLLHGNWPASLARLGARRSARLARLLHRTMARTHTSLGARATAEALLAEVQDIVNDLAVELDPGAADAVNRAMQKACRNELAPLSEHLREHMPSSDESWQKLRQAVLHAVVAAAERIAPGDAVGVLGMLQSRARVWAGAPHVSPRLGRPRPTRLGNAEAAVADRVYARYGLELEVAWPHLSSLIPEPSRSMLGAAERGVDTAVYVAAGWGLAAVGAALAASFYLSASPLLVVGVVGSLALCTSSYSQAITRAVAHGHLVESAVDLHRLELLDALGWRRPGSAQDERALFEALSIALAGGPADERFRRRTAPGERADVGESVDRAIDSFAGRLEESVQRTLAPVAGAVLSTVAEGLQETLQRSLAGPPLTNFNGHVSVGLIAGDAQLEPGRERRVRIEPGVGYRLIVAIGPRPHPSAATARLRVRGGEDSEQAVFALAVDSNLAELRRDEDDIVVPRGGEAMREFAFKIDEWPAEPPWLWVRVMQHQRTLQNIDLTLVGPSDALEPEEAGLE